MVKPEETTAEDPERALALSYAPLRARPAMEALFALDARLGGIVARAREPIIGQMRLTWWFEALERLDAAPPPAEPLLRRLAAEVLPAGVSGAALAGIIDGWEPLLDLAPIDAETVGRERGGRLFAAAAKVLGGADPRVESLGAGWALADLAVRWGRPEAAQSARPKLAACFGAPWPRPLRPLGALGLLARSDLEGGRAGAPTRVGRLLAHRLTGR